MVRERGQAQASNLSADSRAVFCFIQKEALFRCASPPCVGRYYFSHHIRAACGVGRDHVEMREECSRAFSRWMR